MIDLNFTIYKHWMKVIFWKDLLR